MKYSTLKFIITLAAVAFIIVAKLLILFALAAGVFYLYRWIVL